MKRRDFLKAGAAGAGAVLLARLGLKAEQKTPTSDPANRWAAPCGLYCGLCDQKECHGCGCDCGKCAGLAHRNQCEIAHCALKRQLNDCSACGDFPCTRLIQFANDPIWRTHATVIENLRRRKAIGTQRWLQEQQEYWTDEHRQHWAILVQECEQRAAEARKKLKKP